MNPILPILALGAALAALGGCDASKTEEPAAGPASSEPASSKPAASAAPTTSASAEPETPVPDDPVLAGMVGAPPKDAALEKDVAIASAGVAWKVPATWKTMDFSADAAGGAANTRKKSHALDGAASIDVTVMSESRMKDFFGGKDFPEEGDEPYGGKYGDDGGTTFTRVFLGRSKLEALATHKKIKDLQIVYLVFRAPKGEGVVEVAVNWKHEDAEKGELARAVARSLGKSE